MTTSPRHLVILWDYYQHYHYARLHALRSRGAERGWRVTGLAAGRGGAGRDNHTISADRKSDGPVYLGGDDFDLYSRKAAARLGEVLAELNPDAVIIPGYGSPVARAAIRWCRRNRRGTVVIIESQERDHPRAWFKEWIKRRILTGADCAFCGGTTHAAYAAKLGIPSSRIFLGYSAVDNDHWRAAAEAARTRPAPAPPSYFVAVGRFVAKKNFSGLIAAFATFKQTDRAGWRLAIIGDGPERPAIEAAIKHAALASWVLLPGYADSDRTAFWLAHASAFVLPSSHSEQWGLVVNEAMATGLPVIVSSACGCADDLVINGETGIRFDASSQSELTQALTQLATNPGQRASMGNAARTHIARFSLQQFADEACNAAEKSLLVSAARR